MYAFVATSAEMAFKDGAGLSDATPTEAGTGSVVDAVTCPDCQSVRLFALSNSEGL